MSGSRSVRRSSAWKRRALRIAVAPNVQNFSYYAEGLAAETQRDVEHLTLSGLGCPTRECRPILDKGRHSRHQLDPVEGPRLFLDANQPPDTGQLQGRGPDFSGHPDHGGLHSSLEAEAFHEPLGQGLDGEGAEEPCHALEEREHTHEFEVLFHQPRVFIAQLTALQNLLDRVDQVRAGPGRRRACICNRSPRASSPGRRSRRRRHPTRRRFPAPEAIL